MYQTIGITIAGSSTLIIVRKTWISRIWVTNSVPCNRPEMSNISSVSDLIKYSKDASTQLSYIWCFSKRFWTWQTFPGQDFTENCLWILVEPYLLKGWQRTMVSHKDKKHTPHENLRRNRVMSLCTIRQEEISRGFDRGIVSYSSRSRANRRTTIKLTRRNPLRFFYSIYGLI